MSNESGEDFIMSDRQAQDAENQEVRASSIVDRLFDMPGEETEVPEWDTAVARRLERNIADMMRAALRDEPQQRSA